jgi:hypothetical protein
MENKILSKLGYNSGSAKLIVNHYNSSYTLEIRTKDKDISNDNKFIKNLAEGFIIYLIYNKEFINTIRAIIPYSRPYPTKTKIFETYYLEKLENYQPEPIAGLIITENVEAELIPKLIILEKEKFQDIINNKDLRAYIESEFEISFDILKNLTSEFIELLKSKIQNINFDKSEPQKKGFQSSLKPYQIENLFSQMQDTYFDTTIDNFRAIFKNEPLPLSFIAIKKLKPFTSALLAYFIYELFQKENPGDYWTIAENCFNAKHLRKAYNNFYQYNTGRKPKGYEKIDAILKILYTPLQ